MGVKWLITRQHIKKQMMETSTVLSSDGYINDSSPINGSTPILTFPLKGEGTYAAAIFNVSAQHQILSLTRMAGEGRRPFLSLNILPFFSFRSIKLTALRAALSICLLSSVLCPLHAAPDSNSASPALPSGVSMKITEHVNQVVEQGVATMKNRQRRKKGGTLPPVTQLKMDKMSSRYVENNDEIYDRITNLTWARCSFGQRWVKTQGCVGSVRQLSFDQAMKRAGGQWRLPTQTELVTLIDKTKKNMPLVLAINSVAFPDMDLDKLYYWSGTEENMSFAWAVLFVDGGVSSILYRNHRYAVRFVRSGK
jgi:hypothetical protein